MQTKFVYISKFLDINIEYRDGDVHEKVFTEGEKDSCIFRYTERTLTSRAREKLFCIMNTYVGEERLAVSQL